MGIKNSLIGIINTLTRKEKKLKIKALEDCAKEMRAYELIALHAAGSGHSGGSLSITDIMTALYFNIMKHDSENPDWEERDRFILSKGHACPALYTALGLSGYFPIEDTMTLRKFGSDFQGHPDASKVNGVEMSTGSLGQGLSHSAGIAMALKSKAEKSKAKNSKVYCIMGDGEQQEGQIGEAVIQAVHHKLDNLVAIIDKNNLQIDGWVKDVSNIKSLKKNYKSLGWNVLEMDGHNMKKIISTLNKASSLKNKKPTVIIANTIKGKGVSFMEDQVGWHGRVPDREELDKALGELGVELAVDKRELEIGLNVDKLLDIAKDYQKEVDETIKNLCPTDGEWDKYSWKSKEEFMGVTTEKTRVGFGQAIAEIGKINEKIWPLGADISGSINIADFYKIYPELKERFKSLGIAEQSIASVAGGFAHEGELPVFGTYAVFSAGRALDQVRMLAYNNSNVLVLGAHAGVSVGPDGATHQGLEDLSSMFALPNMNIEVPSDFIETRRVAEYLLTAKIGPKYLRYARESTPIITTEETPYEIGKANIIKYRGEQENFIGAFETVLAEDYENENDSVSIMACGPIVAEAMRATWILKEKYEINARVINIHTLKHYEIIKDKVTGKKRKEVKLLDQDAIIRAAEETEIIVTAEEHQTTNGFGSVVATTIEKTRYTSNFKDTKFGMIGINDEFGQSGTPDELAIAYKLRAGNIVDKVLELSGKNEKVLLK